MQIPNKRLVTVRVFADRLGDRSVRTIDRLIARQTPGLPKVIWVGKQRFFDEDEVNRFIAEIIARGVGPGQKPYAPVGSAKRQAERAKEKKIAKNEEARS
jgi:hypothetical protein